VGGTVTYSANVDIEGDRSVESVPFNKFVTRNGNYVIRFSMEGKSNTNNYVVKFVPDSLNVEVSDKYDADTNYWYQSTSITLGFEDDSPNELQKYNKMYDITIQVEGPENYFWDETTTLWALDDSQTRASYSVRKVIESDFMGFHDISVKLENKLVMEGTEYRELEPEAVEVYLNRAPVITNVKYPSTIRANEDVTFTVMASDPDRNDSPSTITVAWDSGNDDSDEVNSKNMTGSTVSFTYKFPEARTYMVYFNVGDSGLFISKEENYKKFNSTTVEIHVRTGIIG
jgi:hypothetical protein